MQKILRVFCLGGLFTIFSFNILACDVCNMNVELFPDDYKHSVSFYYRSRVLLGKYDLYGTIIPSVRHSGSTSDGTAHFGKTVKEVYNLYDLRGTYYFSKPKLYATLILPLINNKRYFNDAYQFGFFEIGDPIIMVKREVFNSLNKRDSSKLTQKLNLGAGIKLPFGSNKVKINNSTLNEDIQPGSGSIDYIMSLDYLIKYNSIGITANMNYKINSANNENYTFGNSLNGQLNLFYYQKIKSTVLVPSIGNYMEYAGKDKQNNSYLNNTGGIISFISGGLTYYWKNFRLKAEYQVKVYDKLNGNTQLSSTQRCLLGASYNF